MTEPAPAIPAKRPTRTAMRMLGSQSPANTGSLQKGQRLSVLLMPGSRRHGAEHLESAARAGDRPT